MRQVKIEKIEKIEASAAQSRFRREWPTPTDSSNDGPLIHKE
jgi:hypothetical protein